MDMERLGGFANYGAEHLARLTFCSIRSARRWRQSGFAPAICVAWLELTHYGGLAPLSDAWEGWRLRNGALHAPTGWAFTPGELLAMPLRYQEISALTSSRRFSSQTSHAPLLALQLADLPANTESFARPPVPAQRSPHE